ncbi:caspase-14-like [Peromyscus californicus insignis]|uniref:caspase-14-like n=1 Tax=Peromyscus californicus insignis TaxID=564181 RepID=UPI0022A6DE1E|nr:caspase-14-like [Peromyscus californicus insignis]
MAPSGQLRQPQLLVQELSRCDALQGCPKIFLLLSSGLKAAWEPEAFLTGLGKICSQHPHWSLLQLLTELFCRVAEEPAGDTYCPVFRTSLRGTLCLRDVEPWRPESDPGPSAQYDLSGTRAALLLAVIQDRLGTQHDVAALGDLCQALGFKVTLRTDPTAQAFWEELAQFQEKLDTHKGPVSCALVALMAHGGPQGQLLGADGREVHPEMLVQELSFCRALQGRPKIFLLQACRGGNRDPGVRPRALPWYRRWLRAPPALPTQADVLQIHVDAPGSPPSTPGSSSQADILTVYAAAEGCVAYRDEEKGSDFVQTLVEVIRANPGGDVIELLTEVNRRVCELDVLGPDSDELRKVCLETRSSLRRRLCL